VKSSVYEIVFVFMITSSTGTDVFLHINRITQNVKCDYHEFLGIDRLFIRLFEF